MRTKAGLARSVGGRRDPVNLTMLIPFEDRVRAARVQHDIDVGRIVVLAVGPMLPVKILSDETRSDLLSERVHAYLRVPIVSVGHHRWRTKVYRR